MNTLLIIVLPLSLCVSVLYILYLDGILAGWGKLKDREENSQDYSPRISVVIACRNEEQQIQALLENLKMQTYPSEKLEYIFIDDGSEDQTYRYLEQEENKSKYSVILFRMLDATGKKQAVHKGIEISTGDWILCTDADCRMGPGWIRSMISFTKDPVVKMVLGPVVVNEKPGWLSRFQQLEIAGLLGITAGEAGNGKAWMGNGANLLYKKEDYLKTIKPTDSSRFASGDDVFLVQSFKNSFGGNSIQFAADKRAVVRIDPEPSLGRLFWQRVRWASKSKGYPDGHSRRIAILALAVNVIILILCITGIIEIKALWMGILLFLIKGIAEMRIVCKMYRLAEQRIHPLYFILSQLIYPLYTLLIAISSLNGTYYWKGRKQQ